MGVLIMSVNLYLHNTLSRKKELFEPLVAGKVGMYVCGPTVYGDPHLGHARSTLTFDLLFRLLKALDYKVRYVRNITDVGHLEHDADEGDDKIGKLARLEQLEPMEVAQRYTNRYHQFMHMLGALDPSIEPHASGHIIEQIELAQTILDKGYAYVSNGSVYFSVEKYAKEFNYGALSGRNLDDMQSGGRSDDFATEKRSSADFALWKKASAEHIMRWNSPWGEGFPGWHCECSAMSKKYLGETFDIHGGGMDLVFPHHECEIAQSTIDSLSCSTTSKSASGEYNEASNTFQVSPTSKSASGEACEDFNTGAYSNVREDLKSKYNEASSTFSSGARFWVHNNMITLNGKKMGKSLGNAISLEQFFTGEHPLLAQAYSPMTIRFFIMQAHYRSTLDFSNEALQATEKGMERLLKAWQLIDKLPISDKSSCGDVVELRDKAMEALCDDLNSPIAIALLFDWTKTINSINDGSANISSGDREHLAATFDLILGNIIGLQKEAMEGAQTGALAGAMEALIEIRLQARANKDWTTSDLIRDRLSAHGIQLKDGKEGTTWELL